jgi:hypothetical protein
MRKLILTICLIIVLASMANAQDDAAETCDTSSAMEMITELIADAELEPLEILRAIGDAVDQALLACEGFSFTSEEEGSNPALGPITLEEGLWRVTVETSGTMFLDLMPLDGTCAGTGNLASVGTLFMIIQPGDGAETLIESEGCEALFEFSMSSADWTMTLEKLR